MTRHRTLLVAALAAACAPSAFAGIILTAEEVGDDVVIHGGGTLDVSTWTFLSPGLQLTGIQASANIGVGPAPQAMVDIYTVPGMIDGPTSIGPGTDPFFADTGGGDAFGLGWSPGLSILAVPSGYTGAELSSTSTYLDHSFDTLGLAIGEYTWTWDTIDGGSDFFTLNVVPAPGALALLGLAALARRRRARTSAGGEQSSTVG